MGGSVSGAQSQLGTGVGDVLALRRYRLALLRKPSLFWDMGVHYILTLSRDKLELHWQGSLVFPGYVNNA